MSKITKIWIITASILLTLGLIIFVGVMSINEWDFTKLSTVRYETNTYVISESFDKIDIDVEIVDVNVEISKDGTCRIACDESEDMKCSYTVKNNTLVISVQEKHKWYDYVQFVTKSPKMTVYLSMNEYAELAIESETGDINISKDFTFGKVEIESETADIKFFSNVLEMLQVKTTTGDITVENVTLPQLDILATTGDVELENVTAEKSIDIATTTGDVDIENVVAKEKLNIVTTTGDVDFEGCDATDIVIETTTGDVSGTLLSDKVFITDTNTGDIDVPKTSSGGRCEIKTTTGDMEIDIKD